jgi:hypothetical protein
MLLEDRLALLPSVSPWDFPVNQDFPLTLLWQTLIWEPNLNPRTYGMFPSVLPSAGANTTSLCLGESREILVDGVTEGRVRSETGQRGLSLQHDDGLGCVRSSGTSHGDLIGVSPAIPVPLRRAKTTRWQDRCIIPLQGERQ